MSIWIAKDIQRCEICLGQLILAEIPHTDRVYLMLVLYFDHVFIMLYQVFMTFIHLHPPSSTFIHLHPPSQSFCWLRWLGALLAPGDTADLPPRHRSRWCAAMASVDICSLSHYFHLFPIIGLYCSPMMSHYIEFCWVTVSTRLPDSVHQPGFRWPFEVGREYWQPPFRLNAGGGAMVSRATRHHRRPTSGLGMSWQWHMVEFPGILAVGNWQLTNGSTLVHFGSNFGAASHQHDSPGEDWPWTWTSMCSLVDDCL